ncbi:MAG: hypothetical protein QMC81_07160 [Thermoanaerobacterales bacterium]|nr:hypothetical protein [Thermoanaerobacterales bacterium]
MAFRRLLMKEIRASALPAGVFAVPAVVWYLFLASRAGVWGPHDIASYGFMPLLLLPVWAAGTAYYGLHVEWNTNTSQLLLSLPLRGWTTIGAKALAVQIGFTALSLLCVAGLALVAPGAVRELAVGPYAWTAPFWLCVGYWLFTVVAVVVGQFTFLAGRMVPRFRGPASGTAFFVASWLMFRLGALLSPLFHWVPDVTLRTVNMVGENVAQVSTSTVNTAPIAAVLFLTAGLFALNGWFLEREVEV